MLRFVEKSENVTQADTRNQKEKKAENEDSKEDMQKKETARRKIMLPFTTK